MALPGCNTKVYVGLSNTRESPHPNGCFGLVACLQHLPLFQEEIKPPVGSWLQKYMGSGRLVEGTLLAARKNILHRRPCPNSRRAATNCLPSGVFLAVALICATSLPAKGSLMARALLIICQTKKATSPLAKSCATCATSADDRPSQSKAVVLQMLIMLTSKTPKSWHLAFGPSIHQLNCRSVQLCPNGSQVRGCRLLRTIARVVN